MVAKEALQLLDLGLLEHGSLLRSEKTLIDIGLVLLELLHLCSLLLFSLLFGTGEGLMRAAVHGELLPSLSIDLVDRGASPGGRYIRR